MKYFIAKAQTEVEELKMFLKVDSLNVIKNYDSPCNESIF